MRAALLALLLTAAGPLAAPAAGDDDAWSALRRLRAALESQPQAAEFVQEYLPAGFASGDRETGTLTLALPDCLRWEYDEPFPKSYLLCRETIWTWNPDETSGRTFVVDPEEERGLDLLRLGVDRLAERYTAELLPATGDATGDAIAIRLEPIGAATEIADALLTLTAGGDALAELSYRDVEGNATRFGFHDHRPVAADAAVLEPPDDLTWIED